METQTRLSRHNKFILAENIVGIFSVSLNNKEILVNNRDQPNSRYLRDKER